MGNEMNLKAIVDIEHIKEILKDFHEVSGFPVGMIASDGEILIRTEWTEICEKFHRNNDITLQNCLGCDGQFSKNLNESVFLDYKCANGLTYAAIPIIIEGKHLASLFIGQFFYKGEEGTEEEFRKRAKKYGFAEEEYTAAFRKIPIYKKAQVKKAAQFCQELVTIISEMGKKNIELLKELESFAYIASHDLQEPLRKTVSFTQLLSRRYSEKLDEKAQKYIFYITDGTKRMQNLITGLLKFSRVTTRGGDFLKVNMQKVVKNVQDNLSLLFSEKDAGIECKNLPEINADENQMLSLFQNLIGNALKFASDRKPMILINAETRPDDWLFSIADNGIGIDEEFSEKVFLIFQRLHSREKYPGSGIGLAVAKRIVERHKGKIWFKSDPGKGTIFYFTISNKLAGKQQKES